MRTRKALINSIMSLLLELTLTVCSLILPRLILSTFGSKYNGITSSITQFVTYISLLRSGIGGVTRASLYKLLSDNDTEGISGIVMATEKFLRQVTAIFAAIFLCFAAIYPIAISKDFSWWFSFSLFVIISISTFAQYYFGFSYQMLLQADQRLYIASFISIIANILSTVVAVILIKLGFGIHMVKLGSAIVFTAQPIVLGLYVKKRYHINTHATPNMVAISQRWDSFAHQMANFVHGNTDVVILTIFSTLEEVSVYSVYAMVITGVRKLVNICSKGMEAAFGNMIARDEKKSLLNNLERLEFIIFYFSAFCFTCAAVLIVPFVNVYTKGVHDADYIRPFFGALMCLAGVLWCFRIPYQTLVYAAGKFRDTRNGAIAEPIINILISVVLVIKFGLIGVAVGTVAAMLFRTIQYAIYSSRHIIERPLMVVWKKLAIISFNIALSAVLAMKVDHVCKDYSDWIVLSLMRSAVVLAVSAVFVALFERKNFSGVVKKIKGAFSLKKKDSPGQRPDALKDKNDESD